ncbi:MAG: hypothetical protein JWP57_276 [Spirosoma sp.]|nr:hypothetical protein [Spirosoma sp.]
MNFVGCLLISVTVLACQTVSSDDGSQAAQWKEKYEQLRRQDAQFKASYRLSGKYSIYNSAQLLNEVHGPKVVVSKGVDQFEKLHKVVIKDTTGHYYNCYCQDLLSYRPGEPLP